MKDKTESHFLDSVCKVFSHLPEKRLGELQLLLHMNCWNKWRPLWRKDPPYFNHSKKKNIERQREKSCWGFVRVGSRVVRPPAACQFSLRFLFRQEEAAGQLAFCGWAIKSKILSGCVWSTFPLRLKVPCNHLYIFHVKKHTHAAVSDWEISQVVPANQ